MPPKRNKVAIRRRHKTKGKGRLGHRRKQFQSTKSIAQTQAPLGLVSDPNVDLIHSRASRGRVQEEMASTDNVSWVPKPVVHREFKVSESETAYMLPLIERYQNDYEKMRRDIKLNYLQKSEGEMKRLAEALQTSTHDE